MLGEMTAGVLLGPFVLGTIALPDSPSGLFPPLEGFPLSAERCERLLAEPMSAHELHRILLESKSH